MAAVKKNRAVMVRLVMKSEGLALSLDDIAQRDGDGAAWLLREHVTHKVLEQSSFDPMSFDDKELADFGFHILARLHAFHELGEAP